MGTWTWNAYIARKAANLYPKNLWLTALLVHVKLSDTFLYHAITYAACIFNVLPIQNLTDDCDRPATPHELFYGSYPNINHICSFSCPIIIKFWDTKSSKNGKQTKRGKQGIFIGLHDNQKDI